MLVLRRKIDQELVIDHPDGQVIVTLVETHQGWCKIGITAPRSVKVDRREISEKRLAAVTK